MGNPILQIVFEFEVQVLIIQVVKHPQQNPQKYQCILVTSLTAGKNPSDQLKQIIVDLIADQNDFFEQLVATAEIAVFLADVSEELQKSDDEVRVLLDAVYQVDH